NVRARRLTLAFVQLFRCFAEEVNAQRRFIFADFDVVETVEFGFGPDRFAPHIIFANGFGFHRNYTVLLNCTVWVSFVRRTRYLISIVSVESTLCTSSEFNSSTSPSQR